MYDVAYSGLSIFCVKKKHLGDEYVLMRSYYMPLKVVNVILASFRRLLIAQDTFIVITHKQTSNSHVIKHFGYFPPNLSKNNVLVSNLILS